MKFREYIKYLIPIVLAAVLVGTCTKWSNKYPGKEYMPEMIHSLAYETYEKVNDNEAFPTGQTALLPPEGAISVNQRLYHLPNTTEGYEQATLITENPIETTDETLIRGQQIYTIHCSPCHGPKGTGQGSAVVGSDYKLAAPPINFAQPPADLTVGRMFHAITYGKGLMGSYASQVAYEDRWKVIHYVQSLEEEPSANTEEPSTDETDEADQEESELNSDEIQDLETDTQD